MENTTDNPVRMEYHHTDEPSWVQTVIVSFLGLIGVDYTIHSLVILYSIACISSRKNSSAAFGLLIATIFILVRLLIGCLLLTVFREDIPWVGGIVSTFPERAIDSLYYVGLSFLLLGVVIPAISGLSLLCSGDLGPVVPQENPKKSRIAPGKIDSGDPMVAVLMPVYNEEPAVLIKAVDHVIGSAYSQARKHLFVSFDDVKQGPLFKSLINHLCGKSMEFRMEYEQQAKKNCLKGNEAPFSVSGMVGGMRLTVSTFIHAGKRLTQSQTYTIIRDLYRHMATNTVILSMDSDVFLDQDCIQNLIDYSTSQGDILGLTGLITCAHPEGLNVLEHLQNADRIEKESMDRTLEAKLGANSCLHGMITLVPLPALMKLAPTYFGRTDVDSMSTTDYHQYQLGEDRYLTLLLMEEGQHWGQVNFTCRAKCKTVFPATMMQLLRQRRRWFLATLVNDMNSLCMPGIWKKYGLLQGFKAYQYMSRGFTIIAWAMVVLHFVYLNPPNLRSYIAVCVPGSFILIRITLAIAAALRLKEYKSACFVPLAVLFFQFFEEIVMIFSLFTWRTRTWGGPRVKKPKGVQQTEAALLA